MKLKKLMFGLAAAALMGGSASATTQIYIVGSTAFRAPATIAILSYLSANSTGGVVDGGSTAASGSTSISSLLGAGDGYFTNAQGTIVVETNWTGSAAGLTDLVTANATGDKFIPTGSYAQIYIPGVTAGSGSATIGTTGLSNTVAEVPNITFCDSFKASIASTLAGASITAGHPQGGATTGAQLAALLNGANVQYAGTSAGAGNQDAVGVIPFAWYSGNDNPAGSTTNDYAAQPAFTNITQQQAALLIGAPASLEQFTGNTGDANNVVFLVGRNEDSGTRLAAFAEAQLGFGPGCDQFELTFSGTSTTGKITTASGGTVSTLPTGGIAATVTGGSDFQSTAQVYTEQYIGFNTVGHSGYASGGDVANVLLADNANPGSLNIDSDGGNEYFVGYLGWSDGYSLTNPSSGHTNAVQLSYNGVAATEPNIANGTYTFWAYEHMYYLTSGTNAIGANKSDADNIADAIFNTWADTDSAGYTGYTPPAGDAPEAGILYSSMNVARSEEGSVVY